MAELKGIIENNFPVVCANSALVNYYPHLNSKINLHSDDEAEIEANSYIVTVSFGSPRKLVFTTKEPAPVPIMYVELKDRSVLIFSKSSQGYFKHGILKENDFKGQSYVDHRRVSITFRMMG